jgi:hypothetical protein
MSDYLVEARPTLTRWLAGERIGPLPMRGADQEAPSKVIAAAIRA